jgi:hypothetical protein
MFARRAARRHADGGMCGKRKHDLSDDLGLLLGNICSEWGFCNRLTAEGLVTAGKPLGATEFARAVLRAEGMNPDHEANWVGRIEERFVVRYGLSVSPESFGQLASVTN